MKPPEIPQAGSEPLVPQRIVALGGIFFLSAATHRYRGAALPRLCTTPPVPQRQLVTDDDLELPLPGAAPAEISLPRNAPQLTFDAPSDTGQHRVKPFAQFVPPPRGQPPAPQPAAAALPPVPAPPPPPLPAHPLSPAEAFAAELPPAPPPISATSIRRPRRPLAIPHERRSHAP